MGVYLYNYQKAGRIRGGKNTETAETTLISTLILQFKGVYEKNLIF